MFQTAHAGRGQDAQHQHVPATQSAPAPLFVNTTNTGRVLPPYAQLHAAAFFPSTQEARFGPAPSIYLQAEHNSAQDTSGSQDGDDSHEAFDGSVRTSGQSTSLLTY